jgi:hypothetical protein
MPLVQVQHPKMSYCHQDNRCLEEVTVDLGLSYLVSKMAVVAMIQVAVVEKYFKYLNI